MFYIWLFRLVNIIDEAKLDQENIWRIARMVRKSFLYEDHGTYCTLAKLNNAILSVDYIKNNINHFAEELNLNTSSIPRDNISYIDKYFIHAYATACCISNTS